MDEVTFLEAIRSALQEAMRSDERVFMMGEDIGELGGAFGVSKGLLDEFGDQRVIDTPISEEGFVGAAIGAAWQGERPIAEMQFADFITCAFDMLVTVAAKTHWRSGIALPLVIRAPSGAGLRGGPFHSASPEGHFVGVPGLKVVCPSTVADAYGLLRAAIEDDNPVIYFEHKGLYRRLKERPPEIGYRTRIGEARIVRPGRDATIVTYGACVHLAAELKQDVEIIDLRTLWPIDFECVLESIARTSRLMIVQEAHRSGGVAGVLLAGLAEAAFEYLDAPPVLHAPADTPVPYAPELEDAYLPSSSSISKAIDELLRF